MKKKTLLAFGVTWTLLTSLTAQESLSDTKSCPLFLKPAFELTEKDQVILDILHEEGVANTHEDFSELEEKDGKYPEAFEKAYERYMDTIGNLRPTRGRYLNAISQGAEQLLMYLFPDKYQQEAATPEFTHPVLQASRGTMASLLIGINYENSDFELANCIHDIEHVMNRLLVPRLGAKKENMLIMSDHKYGSDFYPTLKNIRKQMDHFVRMINHTKCGYFHYSGHGSYIRDYSGDEKDHKDEVLVPVDSDFAGYIKDDEIFETLVKGVNKDVKLTVVTDCCHSGTMMDLPYKWTSDGKYTEEQSLSSTDLENMPDVVMISGCKDTQTSADGGVIEGSTKGAGAMTAAYLQTLEDYEYVITYRQLLEGMHERLEDEYFEQKPQLSSTKKIDLDEYYMTNRIALRP